MEVYTLYHTLSQLYQKADHIGHLHHRERIQGPPLQANFCTPQMGYIWQQRLQIPIRNGKKKIYTDWASYGKDSSKTNQLEYLERKNAIHKRYAKNIQYSGWTLATNKNKKLDASWSATIILESFQAEIYFLGITPPGTWESANIITDDFIMIEATLDTAEEPKQSHTDYHIGLFLHLLSHCGCRD